MTQKQIRRRREVIEAKIREMELLTERLQNELEKLQDECKHPKGGANQYVTYCFDCGCQWDGEIGPT